MTQTTALKVLKIVGSCAGVLLLGFALYQAALANDLLRNSRSPNAAGGRIIPMTTKGVTVFLTESETRGLTWARGGVYGCGGVVVLCLLAYGALTLRTR